MLREEIKWLNSHVSGQIKSSRKSGKRKQKEQQMYLIREDMRVRGVDEDTFSNMEGWKGKIRTDKSEKTQKTRVKVPFYQPFENDLFNNGKTFYTNRLEIRTYFNINYF